MEALLAISIVALGFVVWRRRPRKSRMYAGVNQPIVAFLTTELNRFPLHKAVFKNDFSAVQKLLEQGHDINEETDDGQTPLHIAAECGLAQMCRLLLEHGVNIDTLDNFGGTALHAAAACQKGVDVVRVLVEHGTDIHLKDAAGMTPQALAEKYKHFKIAAYLKLCGK